MKITGVSGPRPAASLLFLLWPPLPLPLDPLSIARRRGEGGTKALMDSTSGPGKAGLAHRAMSTVAGIVSNSEAGWGPLIVLLKGRRGSCEEELRGPASWEQLEHLFITTHCPETWPTSTYSAPWPGRSTGYCHTPAPFAQVRWCYGLDVCVPPKFIR